MLKSAMGTRAASFSAKIRSLQDYHHRLLNGVSPLPSSVDIINVLKFFSQALLTILRDIPSIPIDLLRDPTRDAVRINFFPNLDYRTLYHALAQLLDSFSAIQAALGVAAPAVFDYLLHALVCLVPFLEHELMDCMPMTVARTIALNFVSHQDIIDMLCYNILPFTLYHTDFIEPDENDSGAGGEVCFANESIPSILMIVLSHTDCMALHSQLLECLMRLKSNIIQDLLVVIAYGTGKARHAAVEILFQYWPGLNPSFLDRKALIEKHVPWKPLTCQNETCQNTFNNEAVKICFAQIETAKDPTVQTSDCRGRPPIPLLICIECAELVREHALSQQSRISMKIVTGNSQSNQQRLTDNVLLNVLHPMTEICYTCESKNCLSVMTSSAVPTAKYPQHHPSAPIPPSQQAQAVVTCFAPDCTAFNLNKPVRLCAKCHEARHLRKRSEEEPEIVPDTEFQHRRSSSNESDLGCRHLVQEHLQSLWQLPPDAQLHFSEAVIALLREAAILEKSKDDRRGGGGGGAHSSGPGFTSGVGGGPLGASSGPFGAGPTVGAGIGPGGPMGGGFGNDAGGLGQNTGLGAMSSEGTDSTVEERQLLSRYGIWLLIGLVEPSEADTPDRLELLGRMLAMLCNWFHNTACLPDDQAGSALERIKSESIQGWLLRVIASQFELFASCLIPAPPDFAQIGGHWESWPSMTIQIKEGFKRLLCLVPYDIITADIWAYIMPFWMESFRYDLAEAELAELKILLSKVLDPDLSPLGLPPKQMYHFITICFEPNMMPVEQEQALSWLQILTLLEIPVPINLLNQMFLSGIQSFAGLRELKQKRQAAAHAAAAAAMNASCSGPTTPGQLMETDLNEFASESEVAELEDEDGLLLDDCDPKSLSSVTVEAIVESQLACFVLMLDILLKQFELQEINAHKGFGVGKDSVNTIKLLLEMVAVAKCTANIGRVHTCNVEVNPSTISPTDAVPSAENSENIQPETRSHTPTGSTKIRRSVQKPTSCLNECFFCELSSIWYQLATHLITYFAPLVEITVMTDIGAAGGSGDKKGGDKKMAKSSQSPALNSIHEEQHTEMEMASISSSEAVGDDDVPGEDPSCFEDDDDRMITSVELSQTEQLTMKLLQELELQSDPDVIYHMLQCIKLLALHAGILATIARDESRRRFFLWLQNRLLIPTFWRLLQAEFSQISQNAVPLLLHCVALPGGGGVFGRLVNEDFSSSEWCSRFAAIERVAAFSQFLEAGSVKASSALQAALASVAVHMVHALDDVNGSVAQRALLAFESMRVASLKLYVWCLELQFDLVIADRCLVLSALLQLFNHFHERRVLTWDFFLNRFDALFLEAQLLQQQQNPNDPNQLATRDLRNTNLHSETYKKKIQRAQEALTHTHVKRSLIPAHGRGSKTGSSGDSKQVGATNALSAYGPSPTPPPMMHSVANTPTSAPALHSGSAFSKKFGHHSKESKLAKLTGGGASGPNTAPAVLSTGSSAANRKSSKLAALTGSAFPNNFFHDSGAGASKREVVAEEFAIFTVIHRAMDEAAVEGGVNQETLHLLVFLFMQFLSWPDAQHPVDEKSLNRTQVIVFRHLNTLVGYSAAENQFFLPAFDMRKKPTFSAFLSALADVLDSNLPVGSQLLATVLPVLVYAPAHDRFIYTPNPDDAKPEFSLWLLAPHLRSSWLDSVIVILYKHAYAQNTAYSRFVELLIQIVMNTLDKGLEHRCSPVDVFRRSRELAKSSQSRGEVAEMFEIETTTTTISTTTTRITRIKKDFSKGAPVTVAKTMESVKTSKKTLPAQASQQQNQPRQQPPPPTSPHPLAGDHVAIDIPEPTNEMPSKNQRAPEVDDVPTQSQTVTTTGSGGPFKPGDLPLLEQRSHPNNVTDHSENPAVSSATGEISPPMGGVESVPALSFHQQQQQQQQQSSDIEMLEDISEASTTLMSCSACGCCPGSPGSVVADCPMCLAMQPSLSGTVQQSQHTIASTPQTPQEVSYIPLERLLPIGGELAEPVRKTLSQRKRSSGNPPNTDQPLYSEECCCCCCDQLPLDDPNSIGSSCSAGKCCAEYQATLDAFGQGNERLLPIGPGRPDSAGAASGNVKAKIKNQQFKRQQTTINSPDLKLKNSTLKPSKSVDSFDTAVDPKEQLEKFKQTVEKNTKEPAVLESKPAVPTPQNVETFQQNQSPKQNVLGDDEEEEPEEVSKKEKKKNKKNKKKKSKKGKKSSKAQAAGHDSDHSLYGGTFDSPQPTTPQQQHHHSTHHSSGHSSKPTMVSENGKESSSSHSDISATNIPTSGGASGGGGTSTNTSAPNKNVPPAAPQFHACGLCGAPIEKFDEHELGLCLVALATFVHREPSLAAPLLPQILKLASRYALRRAYPWQLESNVHLPGNTMSIARQFIRCTLHQLLSNGIFRQIFQSHSSDVVLFRAIAVALADFVELNQVSPLKELFEGLVDEKALPGLSAILQTLSNVATYLECVFVDYNAISGTGPSNGLSHAHVAAGISPAICSLLGVSGMGPGPSGAPPSGGVVPGVGGAVSSGGAVVANQPWSDLMAPFEAYLRRLALSLPHIAPSIHNLVPVMRTLLALFKIPGIGAHRSILEPTTKIVTHIVAHSPLLIEHVRELSVLCARAYVRDRERLAVARTFALELVQALRFRTQLPDENLLMLVQWALEDVGGTLPPSIAAASLEKAQAKALGSSGITVEPSATNAADALRLHIGELLDFIADVHALARIKSNFQGTLIHLNEETLGSHLKAGMAQFVALELTRTGGSDHRAVIKYLPWLYSLPSLQQGPKEFLECISHVRLLSWLLLGSLQHSALMKVHPNPSVCVVSQPIPLEASTHIAEHVQAILAGFAEQSKASVLHMSALFYAFLLCQLWTVYCEQLACQNPPGSDAAHQNILVLADFWSKITPGVLQLICYSKGLADTVSLHFLSLMETLMECSSEILARLMPLWLPLFNSYEGQLSGTIRMRLQGVVSWPCPAQTRDDAMLVSTVLIRWLQKIQTKMSQIEMQSSTATQFYCV